VADCRAWFAATPARTLPHIALFQHSQPLPSILYRTLRAYIPFDVTRAQHTSTSRTFIYDCCRTRDVILRLAVSCYCAIQPVRGDIRAPLPVSWGIKRVANISTSVPSLLAEPPDDSIWIWFSRLLQVTRRAPDAWRLYVLNTRRYASLDQVAVHGVGLFLPYLRTAHLTRILPDHRQAVYIAYKRIFVARVGCLSISCLGFHTCLTRYGCCHGNVLFAAMSLITTLCCCCRHTGNNFRWFISYAVVPPPLPVR